MPRLGHGIRRVDPLAPGLRYLVQGESGRRDRNGPRRSPDRVAATTLAVQLHRLTRFASSHPVTATTTQGDLYDDHPVPHTMASNIHRTAGCPGRTRGPRDDVSYRSCPAR